MKIKDFDFKNKQFNLPGNLHPGRDFPALNFNWVLKSKEAIFIDMVKMFDLSYEPKNFNYIIHGELKQEEFTLGFSLF